MTVDPLTPTRPPVPALRQAPAPVVPVPDPLAADAELGRAVLSSLPAHIAVLDRDGRIIAVNEAWTAFAAANGGAEGCGVGCNYVDVCRTAGAGVVEARAGDDGARARSSPAPARCSRSNIPATPHTEKRWFLLTAAPLKRPGGGAVVSHLNITDRKLSEQLTARLVVQVERHRRQIEDLLANVPGVVWEAFGTPDALAHRLRQQLRRAHARLLRKRVARERRTSGSASSTPTTATAPLARRPRSSPAAGRARASSAGSRRTAASCGSSRRAPSSRMSRATRSACAG